MDAVAGQAKVICEEDLAKLGCSAIMGLLVDIFFFHRDSFEKKRQFCNYYKKLNRSRCFCNNVVNIPETIYFQI